MERCEQWYISATGHRSHLALPGCPGDTWGGWCTWHWELTTQDALIDALPGVAPYLGTAASLFSTIVTAVVTMAAPVDVTWAEQQVGEGRDLSWPPSLARTRGE